jgi:hypothetical protein
LSTSFYDISIWEEIRSIVSWQTGQVIASINREISKDTSLVELQGNQPTPWQLKEIMEQRANAWVQRVYDLCCDAYKNRGKAVSEDFDRAVWEYCVEPFIMGQKEADIHHETMSGFLELLLCAVGSPRERHRFLTVSQKDCCLDVRMNVFETWDARLHHRLSRREEAAAVMARFDEAEARARRIVAGLPPDPPPLQPPTQTPSLPQPAAPTPPHASTVSSVPAGTASARANEPVTPERPSALEPVLPPLSPAQEGPVAEAQGVSGVDMPTQPSSSETGTWDTIEISFLSEERVQIRNAATTETRNYAEFGFQDARNGKPTRAWEAFRVLAAERGIIRDAAKAGRKWPDVEKRIQEIRKVLRKHFQISADPIPFVEGTGYQARFKISCSPSFHA